MDPEQAFPQGQLFILPNMTWGQPTYYVNQMVAQSYQPHNTPVQLGALVPSTIDGLSAVSGLSSYSHSSQLLPW